MAFSNTYDTTNTGSAVSNREDLTELLTTLAPEETPITSMARKAKATGMTHDWTIDSLATPVTTGIVEGSDVDSFTDKFANRARIGNYIQKFRRDFKVSDLQEAVDSVGPAKLAQAEVKALKELKRDVEATISSANDRTLSDGVNAGALRGLGDWLDSAGPSDVPAAYRTPSESIHSSGTLTEALFNGIITSIYRESGEYQNLTLVADTALRRVISNYSRAEGTTTASAYTINQDNPKQVIFTVSMYESDQGMVSVINMNPACAPDTTNKDTGYVLNPSKIGIAELIPMGSKMLENQGGGERGYCDCALTLVVDHPQAHGKITAIA